MLASPDQSVLLIIDMQSKLMPAIEDHAHVLSQCIRLAKIAQQLGIPIIGTEENPTGLGENHPQLKALCQTTVTKFHFDGCSDGLISHIPTDRKQLVLVGCEAHVCLMQTALGLLEQGFAVSIAVESTMVKLLYKQREIGSKDNSLRLYSQHNRSNMGHLLQLVLDYQHQLVLLQ